MDHTDHVALIRGGVEGAGPRWLELGAGEGAFTLALADVLGPGARIVAVDKDRRALETWRHGWPAGSRRAAVETRVGDFTQTMPAGPFDGVLAANSIHFVRKPDAVLAAIRDVLAPGGRFVLVEYDADHGNPWVPHPISFATWQRVAPAAGFSDPRLIHRVPSRFLNAIYGALTERTGPGLVGSNGTQP